MYLQLEISKNTTNFVGILKATGEKRRIRIRNPVIRIRGSVSKSCGSGTLVETLIYWSFCIQKNTHLTNLNIKWNHWKLQRILLLYVVYGNLLFLKITSKIALSFFYIMLCWSIFRTGGGGVWMVPDGLITMAGCDECVCTWKCSPYPTPPPPPLTDPSQLQKIQSSSNPFYILRKNAL
jgi:hypothetical protein